jgi:DNA-binding MarR family transcriptional regulator
MKIEIENSLGFLLNAATRQYRRNFEIRAQDSGLSAAQWRLLAHLVHQGELSQSKLAEILEIEPISVSRLLNRMEDGDWIKRCNDPNDRRLRLIRPTQKGLDVIHSAKKHAQELHSDAFAGISETEQQQFLSQLKTVIQNLSHT